MKTRKSGLTLGLFVIACCNAAFAQSTYPLQYREWEVIPFVGSSFIPSFQFSTPVFANGQIASNTVGMRYDPGFEIGTRVHQNVGDYWGADLEYSFASQRLHFTNLSPDIPRLSLNSYIHHFSYDVASLPLPLTKRFRPYGTAGLGAVGYVPGSGKDNALQQGVALNDSWLFLFNLGGGFKYLATEGFAFTFDVKDRLSSVPSYGLPKSARIVNGNFEPGMSRHGILQNWQFNVGFSFQWDEY